MTTNWKALEDYVRGVAALRWSVPCRPEHIDGVDFDGVCRISEDELVLIEITTERTLQKVRDDINKIKPNGTYFGVPACGDGCRWLMAKGGG